MNSRIIFLSIQTLCHFPSPRAGSPVRVPSSAQVKRLYSARPVACEFVSALIYSWWADWRQGADRGLTPVPCTASGLPADNDKIHSAIKRKKQSLHTVNKKPKWKKFTWLSLKKLGLVLVDGNSYPSSPTPGHNLFTLGMFNKLTRKHLACAQHWGKVIMYTNEHRKRSVQANALLKIPNHRKSKGLGRQRQTGRNSFASILCQWKTQMCQVAQFPETTNDRSSKPFCYSKARGRHSHLPFPWVS